MTDYAEFLAGKSPAAPASGMATVPTLNPALKPFQSAITGWALRRGRAAMFEGTGLGKTLQQLVWAEQVLAHDGEVLILTPLAVAEQTVAEAEKFGIANVAYAQSGAVTRSSIVVTNYERFEKFDISRFAGIVLDESGIIKSQDGKTRAILTEACRNVPWKLCCTATPAPNDYTELGQHAEFLGVMTAKEMLSMFFVHDGSIRADDHSQTNDGWRLKRHATRDFWRWLASWSVMVRHPRDLGFDDPDYDLPPLELEQITVPAEYKPTGDSLFPMAASTLSQRIGVRRDTADARVAAAAEIINSEECRDTLLSPEWTSSTTRKSGASLPAASATPPTPNVERQSNDLPLNGANQTQEKPIANRITKKTSTSGKNEPPKNRSHITISGETDITQTRNTETLTEGEQKRFTVPEKHATGEQCLSDYTEWAKENTKKFLGSKGAVAPYADQGMGEDQNSFCPSTTATKRGLLGASCVPLAISASENFGTTETSYRAQSNISVRPPERWIVWCKLNKEQDRLESLLKDKCFSVYGTLPADEKIARINGWLRGERPVLLSKPKICGWGLNFQICNRVIFVGASDSFEETYQAIRRCWRFGQLRPVKVYFIASELEGAVVTNLRRKELAFDKMLDAMAGHMRDLQVEAVRGGRIASEAYNPTIEMRIPGWLTAA